jgi:energy-converting hydrogenase Eha subunit F
MEPEFGAPINTLERPKNNMKTIVSVVLAVIILLCLCCLCSVVTLWYTGDAILEMLGIPVSWLPLLAAV